MVFGKTFLELAGSLLLFLYVDCQTAFFCCLTVYELIRYQLNLLLGICLTGLRRNAWFIQVELLLIKPIQPKHVVCYFISYKNDSL